MCHDRGDGDEIGLTHEFMAIMIGAQRSGVMVALHIVEGTGMIRSKRGRVIILDREELEAPGGVQLWSSGSRISPPHRHVGSPNPLP